MIMALEDIVPAIDSSIAELDAALDQSICFFLEDGNPRDGEEMLPDIKEAMMARITRDLLRKIKSNILAASPTDSAAAIAVGLQTIVAVQEKLIESVATDTATEFEILALYGVDRMVGVFPALLNTD